MANILRFRGDDHTQAQSNLPWYVTGQLDEPERARLEEHLATCACCREDLESERLLAREVVSLPLSADAGWAELRRRMTSSPRAHRLQQRPIRSSRFRLRGGRFGWLLAAQAALLAAFAYTLVSARDEALYHTLGSPTDREAANVIAIFRPNATEAELRGMLSGNEARIVDGPTASGAFALRVPEARRDEIVGRLQQHDAVALAQPIDAAPGT